MRQKWKLPRLGLIVLVLLSLLVTASCSRTPAPEPEPPPVPTSEPIADATPDAGPELVQRLAHGDDPIGSLAYAPDGETLAVGAYLEIRLWTADGEAVGSVEHRHSVEHVAYSPDGALLGGAQSVYGVQLTRVADGEVLPELHGGYDSVLAFAPDGETVATGNREGTVWVWRIADGEQLAAMDVWDQEEKEWLTSLAYSPEGDLLAAGHWDGTVRIWDASRGRLRHTFAPADPYAKANALAFSADGAWLAVAGVREERDHVVRLWAMGDGTALRDLTLSGEAVDLDLSADGQLLLVATSDDATLWDTSDFTLLATIAQPAEGEDAERITCVALAPDGSALAIGRWNGVVELWRIGA